MVQGSGLKLFDCSERIETISLSSSYRLGKGGGYDSKTMLVRYAKRDENLSHLSFHQYFMFVKNGKKSNPNSTIIIPHYVGTNCHPVYPPTKAYAKSVIMIHCPWKTKFEIEDRDFVRELEEFILTKSCPNIVKIPYERVKQRYLEKRNNVEPTSTNRIERYEDFSEAPSDLQECVKLVSTFPLCNDADIINFDDKIDFGEDFAWNVPCQQVSLIIIVY